MAFFFLNKIEPSITKQQLEKELKQYGQLKFIGNFKEDTRNSGYSSSIAEYIDLKDESGFMSFCKSKKIVAIKRKEQAQETTTQSKPQEQKSTNEAKPKNIQIANPSFHFYKDTAYGKDIENFSLTNNHQELFEINDAISFTLKTIYPGLLVGSGYAHPKLKSDDNDFQLGFFFDHTTGLPLISGSSIKGMLKSVCEKQDFMQDMYGQTIDLSIFEDSQTIFYDAFILSSANKDNKIFGSDYITSHYSNEENGMLKSPNPVKFLKILPDVTFKFQFKTNENIAGLFKKIIIDFGLGAKTNVGYGKFIG